VSLDVAGGAVGERSDRYQMPVEVAAKSSADPSCKASTLVSWVFARSTTHVCDSVHLLLAANGCLTVRRPGPLGRTCGSVLIPPAVLHQIDVSGRHLLIGCVDGDTDFAKALRKHLDDRIVPVDDVVIVRLGTTLTWLRGATREAIDTWLQSTIACEPVERQIHPAVRRALEYVRRHELDSAHTSLAHLAQVADLSPSRLMHVFTESMFVPLRPYLSWLRLQRAIEAFGDGHSVTDAAYLASFADGSHLARTFRRILGVTPRTLAARGGCAISRPPQSAASQVCFQATYRTVERDAECVSRT